MATANDILNKMRRFVWPPIDTIVDTAFDAYAVSTSTEDEYAATVTEPREKFARKLERMGFERTPFAALKVRVDGNVSDGSWVWRESKLADTQIHIVIHQFPSRQAIDVYAHAEDSWLRHPFKHIRKRNYDPQEGVQDVRALFDEYADGEGLAYEIRPRYRRENQWMLFVVYSISKPLARKLQRLLSSQSAEEAV